MPDAEIRSELFRRANLPNNVVRKQHDSGPRVQPMAAERERHSTMRWRKQRHAVAQQHRHDRRLDRIDKASLGKRPKQRSSAIKPDVLARCGLQRSHVLGGSLLTIVTVGWSRWRSVRE